MGTKKHRSDATRAAIYCRISEDPRGLGLGVSRQREDCEALASARGWKVVAIFTDNDISALKGQARPGYEQLMAGVAQGEFDRIVAYQLSRLWRNRRERAHAIDTLSEARVGVALVKGQELDLTTATGKMYAGIIGEFDSAESEIKAERVARAASQRAQEGRANGQCAFGWKREYQRDAQGRVIDWYDVVDEPAAKIVRSIVDDLLAGIPLRSVTARLNSEGTLSPLGKPWIPSSVRKLAVRELNIGVRRHGDDTYTAAWEPIIDPEKHARVIALLSDPARRTQRAASRSHLLTFGIGYCGACRGVLAVKRVGPPDKKTSLYTCKERGCVGRREHWVDELVARTVCQRLSMPDAASIFQAEGPGVDDARQLADELRARLDNAADAYAEGQIDRNQLTRITEKIRPDLEAAEQRLRRPAGVPAAVQPLLGTADVRAAWDELDISQKRAVLQALGLAVVINPARGGPGFKAESIDVKWPED